MHLFNQFSCCTFSKLLEHLQLTVNKSELFIILKTFLYNKSDIQYVFKYIRGVDEVTLPFIPYYLM